MPDHRKMEFRIGINLGDVIVEGERIYGDGVNIAARVEGLAEAAEFVRMSPAMSWEDWRKRLPYKDEAVIERFFDILRKAGIKSW